MAVLDKGLRRAEQLAGFCAIGRRFGARGRSEDVEDEPSAA